MTPELLTGIVSAVGATFGAAGVVIGNIVTGRSQRETALQLAQVQREHTTDQAEIERIHARELVDAERRHARELAEGERQYQDQQAAEAARNQQAETRRQVYVTYLASLAVFQSCCRELADELERATPDDLSRCDRTHERYMANWHEMVKNQAAVEILGPQAVAYACWGLGEAIGAFSYVCDVWYARSRHVTANNRWAQFHEKEAIVRNKREEFIDATRPVVNGTVSSSLTEAALSRTRTTRTGTEGP